MGAKGRTAVIHAGLPKTGTSTIQKALFENRAKLLKEFGILYPGSAPNHSEPVSALFGPTPATMIELMGMQKPGQSIEDVQREIRALLDYHLTLPGWNTLLLSAEDLSNYTRLELSSFRRWLFEYVDRVRILFWTRSPVAYTVSNVQQLVRHGYLIQDMSAEGSDIATPNLATRLGEHSAVFGDDAIEVRTLESAAAENGGIVAAFCRQIGLPGYAPLDLAATMPASENQSMSLRAAYAINELNAIRPLFLDGKINPARTTDDATRIAEIVQGPKFDLPGRAKERIREAVRADVQAVNDRFGLDLYPEVFSSDTLIGRSPPPDLASLRDIAIRVSDENAKLRSGAR